MVRGKVRRWWWSSFLNHNALLGWLVVIGGWLIIARAGAVKERERFQKLPAPLLTIQSGYDLIVFSYEPVVFEPEPVPLGMAMVNCSSPSGQHIIAGTKNMSQSCPTRYEPGAGGLSLAICAKTLADITKSLLPIEIETFLVEAISASPKL